MTDTSATEIQQFIERIESALRSLPPGVDETKVRRALSLAAEALRIPKGTRRAHLFRDARALYQAAVAEQGTRP